VVSRVFSYSFRRRRSIDFRLKTIDVKGRTIKVQVWDTAGQERFRTITHNYYRGAHGIALVYDVTNEASFQNIRKWIQDVHTYAEQSVNLVLIGNKCDLMSKRVVDKARGEALAKEYEIKFFETSAKTDENVDAAFSTLVADVCDRMFAGTGGGGGGGGGGSGQGAGGASYDNGAGKIKDLGADAKGGAGGAGGQKSSCCS
jgi:small GTP-binding protein